MIRVYVKYDKQPELNSVITLTKDDINKTVIESLKDVGLPWPPSLLILRVGKRRWYELTELDAINGE